MQKARAMANRAAGKGGVRCRGERSAHANAVAGAGEEAHPISSSAPSQRTRAQEAVEAYCAAVKDERGASACTVRAYHADLSDYVRWAAAKRVDALAPGHRGLRKYLADLDAACYARRTVSRRLSSLKGFFSWLCVTGRATEDPADALIGPKLPERLPHVISPHDMARLLSAYAKGDGCGGEAACDRSPADVRNQALLEFLYACGARISEASGLLMSDVDFAQRQVKVLGKGSKERIVPIHDLAVSSMKAYALVARPKLLKGKTCDRFFVSTRGNPMGTDAMRKMFKEALSRAGLDPSLSPHDMRHTFATDLLAGGADLRTVQELLGHASLSTTQVYTHTTPGRLARVRKQALPRA